MPTQTTALILGASKGRKGLLVLAAVILVLAAFVAWTTAQPIAFAYGSVGATVTITLAILLGRKPSENKSRSEDK